MKMIKMKRATWFALFLILFSVTLVANTAPELAVHEEPLETAPEKPVQAESPVPPPDSLLLLGTGMILLIIAKKKHMKEI